jgi:hypothetical protein
MGLASTYSAATLWTFCSAPRFGLWFWLRLKPWYQRWRPILYAFALVMPTLAILGFFEGGRQVMAMAEDPAWLVQLAQKHPPPAPADAPIIDQLVVWVRYAFVAALSSTSTSIGRLHSAVSLVLLPQGSFRRLKPAPARRAGRLPHIFG